MKKKILYILLGVMLLSVKGMGQSISFTNPFSFPYDGVPHRPNDEIVCSAFSGYNVSRTYTDQFGNSVAAPINAGSYIVTVSVTGGCVLSRSQNFTITPAPLTIKAKNANKEFGTDQGTLVGSNEFIATGLQNDETIGSVTLNFGAGARAATDPVGNTSDIIPSVPVEGTFTASNYTINYVNGTLTVNASTLTVTASNQNKLYGAVAPLTGTLNTNYTVTGLKNTDAASGVALSYSGSPTGNLANATVGTYSITATGLTLSAGSLTNYTINYVNGTLTVNAATLTVTANNQNKLYGAVAPLTGTLNTNYTVAGLKNTDAVSGVVMGYSGSPTGNLATASVGTYSITATGLTLSSGSLTNYTINYLNGTLTVNAATLTVTASDQSKLYGSVAPLTGTLSTNYTVAGLKNTDAVSGVVLGYSGSPTGNLATAPVGTYSVTASGLTLSAGSLTNYAINYLNGTLKVNKLELTIEINALNKVYDGNTNAEVTLTDNRISGDDLTVNKTGATFNNKNIGTGKTITVSGINLTGTDAGNYTITSATATGTASITVKSLTLSVTASDKVYDGNTTADATLTDNRITGDVFTVNKTATFNNKNIGIGKAVAVSSITLDGADAGNYSITSSTTTGTASITVKGLTITATVTDKEYDGNTTAIADLTDSRISGDVFTVNKTGATFNNKNIGTGKAVTVSGITITGTDAGNYTLTTSTATGTASITAKSLTITATATDKVYDGNTTATAVLTDNRVSGDDITVNKTGTTFDNKNIGIGKVVTVSGITLTGTDAGNYSITSSTTTGTASITVKNLTITATATDKEYDGNTIATAALTDNRITGDVLTVNKTGVTFNNKNIGIGKAITVAGITLTGTDAGNYTLTSSTATGTASITAKSLTISATVANKEYDGNVNAAVFFSDNRISGDVLTVNKNSATFNNKNVGVGKTVTINGINLTGTDAGNYILTNATASGTASITARNITISTLAKNKPYDGNNKAEVTLSDNKIIGDIITTSHTLAEFDTKEIGDNKTVTVTGISLQGLDSLNYSLTNTTATAYANITGTPEVILVLPNAFTPNGDNNNDEFKVAASNTLGKNAFKSLEIYNRNGKLMFRTEDISKGWNGLSDNVMQDMGVYFVKLVKLNKDGQLVVETSPIYLLK